MEDLSLNAFSRRWYVLYFFSSPQIGHILRQFLVIVEVKIIDHTLLYFSTDVIGLFNTFFKQQVTIGAVILFLRVKRQSEHRGMTLRSNARTLSGSCFTSPVYEGILDRTCA
ncbi:hypothetical protein F5887DRAFT_969824 [Amanita rubescens]|nr:hypothetical protein F5887DRAFT_969824 [Amanita rubescens]